jgi:hypothetical protein
MKISKINQFCINTISFKKKLSFRKENNAQIYNDNTKGNDNNSNLKKNGILSIFVLAGLVLALNIINKILKHPKI